VLLSASGDTTACAARLTPTGTRVYRTAGNATQFACGPFAPCVGGFSLVLQQSGALALVDPAGVAVWASSTGCTGPNATTACYTAVVRDDCTLAVKDGSGAVVWSSGSSPTAAGSNGGSGTGAAAGVKQQLASHSTAALSCRTSTAASPAALVSQGREYHLNLTYDGRAMLQGSPSGQLLWTAATAAAQPAPAKSVLCIGNNGSLNITAAGGPVLWRSSHNTWDPNGQRFTAEVTSSGQLGVYDKTCLPLFRTALPGTQRLPPPAATGRGTGGSKAAGTVTATAPPVSAPQRKAPPVRPASAAAANSCSKWLQAGQACGGLSACGGDGPCQALGCCSAGLLCTRSTAALWSCRTGQPVG
jgi:hypothetical protein